MVCLVYCYIYNATGKNDNRPVAALERPLPLLPFQLPSTAFNLEGTNSVETD